MPTRGRVGAQLSSLKLCASRPDFPRVGRDPDERGVSEGLGSVLAKSAGALPASQNAKSGVAGWLLFAKKPRVGRFCPRPLRGLDEKGRGRFVMGRATDACLRASVMLLPQKLPAKTSRRRGRPALDVKVLLRRSHDERVAASTRVSGEVVAFDLLFAQASPDGQAVTEQKGTLRHACSSYSDTNIDS
jgi:hypothetical protein